MPEHKDTTIFDQTIELASGVLLHVAITIIDVLARPEVRRG